MHFASAHLGGCDGILQEEHRRPASGRADRAWRRGGRRGIRVPDRRRGVARGARRRRLRADRPRWLLSDVRDGRHRKGRRVVRATVISPDLFEAARLGDPQAIASLLETAQPHTRRYARATCRSSADAEDATQEALWILFRHVGTIRSWLAFSAGLFSVVRRECLRLARKAGLASPIEDGEAEALLLSRPEADLRLRGAAGLRGPAPPTPHGPRERG